MSPSDFDRLTLFVAICEEMRHEPYFSFDVHERLFGLGPDGSKVSKAKFVHPVFLKSAVLPFRKLWLASDESSFAGEKGARNGIRDIVFGWFDVHGLQAIGEDDFNYPSRKQWFTERYDWLLSTNALEHYLPLVKGKFEDELTVSKVLDVWINAEVVHVSKKTRTQKTKTNQADRLQFESFASLLGHELFEYLFRINVRSIGCEFQEFGQKLAIPLWQHLREKESMTPSFDARFALTYNPYAHEESLIEYKDHFWHLDKETPGATLLRLLARHDFHGFATFLKNVYPRKSAAIEAILVNPTFAGVVEQGHSSILPLENDSSPDYSASFLGNGTFGLNGGGQIRYQIHKNEERGVTLRLHCEPKSALQDIYSALRTEFLKSRAMQSVLLGEDQWPNQW